MVLRTTLSGNETDLYIAEEASPGVLPMTPDWYQGEPNSYGDFGANLMKIARSPINSGRQRKKGTLVGVEAMASYVSDLTAENMQSLLQGFLLANLRRKKETASSAITSTGYTVASGGAAYLQGDLLLVKNAALAANGGLKVVGASSTGTEIKVAGLVAAAGDVTSIVCVGYQFASGDVVIDATAGGLPKLTSTAKDFTTLGLAPGEFIFLGGDTSATRFANIQNTGRARIKTIAAHEIVFDKTDLEYVDDAGTGKTVQMFFGRLLKNEAQGVAVERSYQIMRLLGAPDTAQPLQIQSQYLVGCAPNTLTLNAPEKERITVELGFLSMDQETRDGVTGRKSGNLITVDEKDALNTAGDMKRVRMCVYDPTTAAPVPLFALVTELNLTIDNNVEPVNAMGYIGAAEFNVGEFTVGGTLTGYFADVAAIEAIRANEDATFDISFFRDNQGVVIDLPLVTLGDGRLAVEANKPITIPLDMQASTGKKYDAAMDYTISFGFFDYLPDVANIRI